MPYRNIPIVQVTVRSPKGVFLFIPMIFPVMSILIVSIVFTIWPEALNHSPIGFEPRGFIHHVWHYSLMGGSILALWGMFSPKPHRLPLEAAGLLILLGALGMNTAALVGQMSGTLGGVDHSGLDLTLRFGVLAMFAVRVYILIVQPTVRLPTEPSSG